MKIWTIIDGDYIEFSSYKEASKWSKKNYNADWYYDNGNGPKSGLRGKEAEVKYLSEITGLKISYGYNHIKKKGFFTFENNHRAIFQVYSYYGAKAFALGFIAGKNNA